MIKIDLSYNSDLKKRMLSNQETNYGRFFWLLSLIVIQISLELIWRAQDAKCISALWERKLHGLVFNHVIKRFVGRLSFAFGGGEHLRMSVLLSNSGPGQKLYGPISMQFMSRESVPVISTDYIL